MLHSEPHSMEPINVDVDVDMVHSCDAAYASLANVPPIIGLYSALVRLILGCRDRSTSSLWLDDS